MAEDADGLADLAAEEPAAEQRAQAESEKTAPHAKLLSPSCHRTPHSVPGVAARQPGSDIVTIFVGLPSSAPTPAGDFTPCSSKGCRNHERRVARRPPAAGRRRARLCAGGTDRTRPRMGPDRNKLLHAAGSPVRNG